MYKYNYIHTYFYSLLFVVVQTLQTFEPACCRRICTHYCLGAPRKDLSVHTVSRCNTQQSGAADVGWYLGSPEGVPLVRCGSHGLPGTWDPRRVSY